MQKGLSRAATETYLPMSMSCVSYPEAVLFYDLVHTASEGPNPQNVVTHAI